MAAPPPAIPANAYRLGVDVRFRDLDVLGHVNSSTVFTYAETARVRWLVESGLAASAEALPVILAAARAEYHLPIPPNAQVEVAMWVSRIGTKSWEFTYAIHDLASGARYATVSTTQVAYDYRGARSVPLDAPSRDNLARLAQP